MGEVIDPIQDATVVKNVLKFIMIYEICPKDLVRFKELYDYYETQLGILEKAVIDELIEKLNEDEN